MAPARSDARRTDATTDAEALGTAVLAELLGSAPEGIAVLEQNKLRFRWVNGAAAALLATEPGDIRGRHAAIFEPLRAAEQATVHSGGRELECTATSMTSEQGTYRVVRFRDVTAARRRERELRAFGNTSASIAFAGSLTTVLDRLAAEVKHATGMFACTFLLMDGHTVLQQAGRAGSYPDIDDYADRLNQCTALGAPLLALDAYEQRRPIVVEGWREITLADARFAPIHEFSRAAKWSTIAVVPLIVRDQIMGVLNGFYLPGHAPQSGDLPFLSAIADQAAVAVENARLVSTSERRAALEERHRLARELHDSVSQALFSLTLQTRAVELLARSDAPDLSRVADGLADIRELTAGALAEMRALIFQLRPAALHEEGLVAAITKHAAAITAKQELQVTVVEPDVELRLAADVEEQLFRILQEALHNVVKHACAGSATVRIAVNGRHLDLEVADDGTGFDPSVDRPGHLGLQSMNERVAALGGTLRVASTDGGTTVRAHIPDVLCPPKL